VDYAAEYIIRCQHPQITQITQTKKPGNGEGVMGTRSKIEERDPLTVHLYPYPFPFFLYSLPFPFPPVKCCLSNLRNLSNLRIVPNLANDFGRTYNPNSPWRIGVVG